MASPSNQSSSAPEQGPINVQESEEFRTDDQAIPPPTRQGRTLVLCFDGTANEFDDTNTNVVKLFNFLEKESPKQLVYYQTGVGTYVGPGFTGPISKSIAKMADLGVAWYLDAHLMGGYRFLQSTWEPGDKICLFGFSRGAYTARALAGMLYTVGLLPKEMPEQVHFAYDIFKKRRQSAAYKRAFSRTVTIEFLGVWDTVSSVGAIFPRVLPFSADNHITKTFRHALALDEHRAKFRSNTWHLSVDPETEDEDNHPAAGVWRNTLQRVQSRINRKDNLEEAEYEEERLALDMEGGIMDRPPTDVKEVWFAGCHCDVGGGNQPDKEKYSLANIPLRWMIKEIVLAKTGIRFRQKELLRAGIDLDLLVNGSSAEGTTCIPEEEEEEEDPESSEALKKAAAADAAASEAEAKAGKEAVDTTAEYNIDADAGSTAKSPLPDGNSDAEKKQSRFKKSREYKDATSPITDELTRAPGWWILEVLPFMSSKQDKYNKWKSHVRVNLFRPRHIPIPPDQSDPNSDKNSNKRGVNISDVPALFHVSVKHRMEAPECKVATWRTLWRKKDTFYKPRAWPRTGDPVFVE